MLATAALLAGALALPAGAMEISYESPAELEKTCISAGGIYDAPNRQGVYMCTLQTGAVIACGGLGGYAKTCENTARERTGTSSQPVASQATPGAGGVLGRTPGFLGTLIGRK
jgi:hypothetical protein